MGAAAFVAVLAGACARMEAPRGGPEDRIPPMVVSTVPDTFAVIEPTQDPVRIRFSERISERPLGGSTLDQVARVSPTTSDVRVKHSRNGLEVSLLGGFEAGTVYRVTILPLVQDRFGNPMPDVFEFFFSTGPEFEANVVAGVVTDRLTGQPVEAMRVDAVPAEAADAAAALAAARGEDPSGEEEEVDLPPAYTAVTDSLGIFAIRYLPADRYRLIAYEDQNRNGIADFRERQNEQMALIVGPADTLMPLNFHLLQPDTTPAVLVRLETLDSLFLRASFDDYMDPEDEYRTVAVRFERAEGLQEAEGELPLQERILQEHLFEAYRDSLYAWADSVARVRADSIAAARADSLAAAGVDPEALDTAAIDPAVAEPEPVEAGPEAPAEIPQELLDSMATGEQEEPLPQQSLVVALRRPMLPGVVYQVTITGLVNIAGLGNGGGEAGVVWELPEEEPPDTAAAQPDTATAPPDTTVVEPPDSVPPDTTVAEPPDSVPPDTTVVALRQSDPGSGTLRRLIQRRRRLPLPPGRR